MICYLVVFVMLNIEHVKYVKHVKHVKHVKVEVFLICCARALILK